MGQEMVFVINDFYRQLAQLEQQLLSFESPRCDPRIKAMIRTKVQEARLLSLELIKQADE